MCNSCSCCFNTLNKKCYQAIIMFSSVLIFTFEMILVAAIYNSIKPEEIQSFIFSETPLYDFEISENNINNKENIIFFEFKGRERKEGNNTVTYDETNITKILGNKFLYNGKDRNYFDYKKEYSVEYGSNCPENHKNCGILDSGDRILCLPNDEECPLNGLWISNGGPNSNYDGYEYKKVYDSIDNSLYYIYYTNNNPNGKVITEFKLSSGVPCAKSSEKNWYQYYNNEVEKYEGCISNGKGISSNYIQVSNSVIKMGSLYWDNGLLDPPSFENAKDKTVFLYARNYIEIDETCFEGFIQDLNDEKKYYDSVLGVVRSLGTISVAVIIALFIYMIVMCRYELIFYNLALIAPIYGIICNIVILGVINKQRIRYKCQIEGFNENIDELLDKQYDNNNVLNIIMSAFSLAFYILVLIFELCLKFMKNRNIGGVVQAPVQPVVVQPVYSTGYPVTYGTNMDAPPGSYGIAYS